MKASTVFRERYAEDSCELIGLIILSAGESRASCSMWDIAARSFPRCFASSAKFLNSPSSSHCCQRMPFGGMKNSPSETV